MVCGCKVATGYYSEIKKSGLSSMRWPQTEERYFD